MHVHFNHELFNHVFSKIFDQMTSDYIHHMHCHLNHALFIHKMISNYIHHMHVHLSYLEFTVYIKKRYMVFGIKVRWAVTKDHGSWIHVSSLFPSWNDSMCSIFTQKSDLKKHTESVHEGKKPFLCTETFLSMCPFNWVFCLKLNPRVGLISFMNWFQVF